MKIIGKLSFFGGHTDNGMSHSEGLSLFEHHEADLRPDLFFPQSSDPTEGTSKRLRNTQAYYIALRVTGDRDDLKNSVWMVKNPKTGQSVLASLVDYGPHERTGRAVDVSDAIGRALRVETDDVIEVTPINYAN